MLADREGLWFIPPHMVQPVLDSGEVSKARDDWSLMMLGTGKYTSRQIYGPLTPELQKQFVLMHFFNHQTHHRGQVTTLLSQEGIDVGVTDLLMLVPETEA